MDTALIVAIVVFLLALCGGEKGGDALAGCGTTLAGCGCLLLLLLLILVAVGAAL